MTTNFVPRYRDSSTSMKKVDRLDWTAGIAFESYGLKIGIRTNEPAILARVLEWLPPGWKPVKSPTLDHVMSLWVAPLNKSANRNEHLLYGGATQLVRTLDLDEVFESLENNLQIFVAEWAKTKLFIHAGVVGWKGKAIVIPGRSYNGKSTLVATLLKAGATYYSDEYAVVDGRGRVHAYPRRLSLRRKDQRFPERRTAEELGGAVGEEPIPLVLVVAAKYMPGGRWQSRELSPGRTLLELLDNTVPAKSRPELTMNTLHRVVPRLKALKGIRGEADEAVKEILRLVA